MFSEYRPKATACPKTSKNRVDRNVAPQLKLDLSIQMVSAHNRAL
jgi:hypothetical protein